MVKTTTGAWLCAWIDKLTPRRATKPRERKPITHDALMAALTLANHRSRNGKPTTTRQVLREWNLQ